MCRIINAPAKNSFSPLSVTSHISVLDSSLESSHTERSRPGLCGGPLVGPHSGYWDPSRPGKDDAREVPSVEWVIVYPHSTPSDLPEAAHCN